jgi:hypothetical protein
VTFPARLNSGLLALVLSLSPLVGCSRADTATPVATASFSASKSRVALGGPVDLTYKFDVAPNAKIDGDYRVFVHILDADGKVLWFDDHDPPVPTSQWKPGQAVGPYTRTVFVPVVPYLGEATVRVGLYQGDGDGARLPLTGLDPADRNSRSREYKVGTLQLVPSSENVLMISRSGWNQDEYDPKNPTNSWRWTQKLATLSFRNPRKDVTLFLDYDARADLFGAQPQTVTVSAGDQVVATFAANSTAQALQRIPITAAQLGTGDMVDVKIELDKTFVPATLPNGGNDHRELGIRVYHVFVEPKG